MVYGAVSLLKAFQGPLLYCHGTFCPNLNPFMAKETEIV